MSKIKLSDTLRFLAGRLNKVTGGNLELCLDFDESQVSAGCELTARARLRSPGSAHRTMDFLRISMKGQVQRDGKWQEFVQTAEVGHDTALPPDCEYIVPIVILVPPDAVLSEDGAVWTLRAQAVVDRTIDPRAEVRFEVVY